MNKTVPIGVISRVVNNDRRSLLVLPVIVCSIFSVLISNILNAADPGHEVLLSNTNNCFKDIGSQLRIEGATYVMGDDHTYHEEGPAHEVTLSSFWIDAHEVTNGVRGICC